MLSSFKGTSHVCCHFPRKTAPLKELCKVLLHVLRNASLKECYTFQKCKNYVQKCVTFGTWILQKSDATLLHVFRNATLYTSNGCCIHSRTFFESKTCSKFFCIYCIHYKEVEPFKHMPHIFIQCVRYSCKGVPHPFKDFPHK